MSEQQSSLAKCAELQRAGSHSVSDDGSHRADGISREEVFVYFSAKWRSKDVRVTMRCDRYCASDWNESTGVSTNILTDWRVYASEARYYDETRNGGRGDDVTGTARSALGGLCEPLAVDWLASDAYADSFQSALARMIMRHFRDDYSASSRVSEALTTFKSRLEPAFYSTISETLEAYRAYVATKDVAECLINGEV